MNHTTGFSSPDDDGADDALEQAEEIVNQAASDDALDLGDQAADEQAAGDALTQAEAKAAEHLGDLQRLQAEYVNYRKRVDRDRALITETAHASFVEALLPVLDDLAAARQHGDLSEGPFAAIAEKFEETLGRFGWTSFGEKGEAFDPTVHEALMSQTSAEVDGPTVTDVVQRGHRIGERVVRPARVIVAQPEG